MRAGGVRFGAIIGTLLLACGAPANAGSSPQNDPTYVGGAACVACHQQQSERWRGSHHDLAMAVADQRSVLGNFADATFTSHGLTSTFHRRDGKFVVRTDGRDGVLDDFEIQFTFGVAPLQQYLIGMPDGRRQALSVAWDSRAREQGGQRWFHLYPDERIAHGDELHWTRPSQNWNFMCADCHSTGLHKGYDPGADRFHTTWSEINVSCEACHGPGSSHVKWAQRPDRPANPSANGLTVHLRDTSGGRWELAPEATTAARTRPRQADDLQVETCARCHARRTRISDADIPGRPLLDAFLPTLLDESLYFADGQIHQEVYEYASFRQSKMYGAGVVCSDCHEPHRLELRAPGDQVCAQCHRPAHYASKQHHFHDPSSAGARCTSCHMPKRTYMVVDPRLDHSIRVPRPDLSEKLETPNACTQCHADRSVAWAAQAAAKWWPRLSDRKHFGTALHAGRTGAPGAQSWLLALAGDDRQPAVARATAISLLSRSPSKESLPAIAAAGRAGDPEIRGAAIAALRWYPAPVRLELAASLLRDPVAAVRIESGRLLADVPSTMLSSDQRAERERALSEYVAAQRFNADRAFGHLNLGNLDLQLGDVAGAEGEFRKAIQLEPRATEAYVNLADLYRSRGREAECGKVLAEALAQLPESAELHHAYGLFLVRQKQRDEALRHLARGAQLRPENVDFSYVYAVALSDSGKSDEALAVLRQALLRQPYQRDILYALVTTYSQRGDHPAALRYARQLATLVPNDERLKQMIAALEQR